MTIVRTPQPIGVTKFGSVFFDKNIHLHVSILSPKPNVYIQKQDGFSWYHSYGGNTVDVFGFLKASLYLFQYIPLLRYSVHCKR